MNLRVDLYSLQLFLAVLEEGSIAAAATREHIAPSALSKRLSELERMLDVVLFQRHARGVEPTSAAKALARRSRALIHQTQDLASEIRDYSTGLRGRVRVAANPSSIVQFLPRELRQFMDAHPNVQIDLEESISANVTRSIVDNAADIGVYMQSDDEQGLDIFPYHRDVMTMVVAPGHPLAKRKQISFLETLDYDHVGMHRGSAANYLFTREAAALNRTLRLRFQVTSYDALVAMVRANLGLGIVPRQALSAYLPDQLCVVPLTDAWAHRHLKLCVRSNEPLSGAARLLLDHLISHAADQAT